MNVDIHADIRRFGSRGQIVYGHVQGVQGTAPEFRECFLEEADCDFLEILKTFKEVGFTGALIPGHLPHTIYDGERVHHGFLYSVGYLKGFFSQSGQTESSRTGSAHHRDNGMKGETDLCT